MAAVIRTRRTASLAKISVRMRGVDYRLETIASALAHGHPRLDGALEPLNPIRHAHVLAALVELVARRLFSEYPMLDRATRLSIAREVVYLSGLTAAARC